MKIAQVCYNSAIGPDNPEEAREIHRGVYDGGVKIWRPDTFAKKIMELRKQSFREFEENEKHYYLSVMVSIYFLKYAGLAIAFSIFPKLA